MNDSTFDRTAIFLFRIAMGWTFLYAGVSQITDPSFSVTAFLAHTKTFHNELAIFAAPAVAPYMTFLVEWGHTLIGLSLITGCLVKLSSPAGVFLMILYYFAHMDWPYIESHVNFIIDYHLVYALVLVALFEKSAGRVWGLDARLNKLPVIEEHRALRAVVR